jgi:hypothetical protein
MRGRWVEASQLLQVKGLSENIFNLLAVLSFGLRQDMFCTDEASYTRCSRENAPFNTCFKMDEICVFWRAVIPTKICISEQILEIYSLIMLRLDLTLVIHSG